MSRIEYWYANGSFVQIDNQMEGKNIDVSLLDIAIVYALIFLMSIHMQSRYNMQMEYIYLLESSLEL